MKTTQKLLFSIIIGIIFLLNKSNANLVTDYVFTQDYGELSNTDGWGSVPFYNWDPCSNYAGTGHKVCGASKMFSIGFNFNYDCREFTEVSVNANGVLSFGNNTSPYEYGDGYYTAYMGDFEKCNWDGSGQLADQLNIWTQYDCINPEEIGGSVVYNTLGSAPNRVFIVQWNTQYYYDYLYGWYGGQLQNFEVRLYEGTNKIEFVYGKSVENSYGYTSLISTAGDGSAKTISNYYYGNYDWPTTYNQYYSAQLYYGYDWGYGRANAIYQFTPCLSLKGRTGVGQGGFTNMGGSNASPATPPLLSKDDNGYPLPKTNAGTASNFTPMDLCVTDPACGIKYYQIDIIGGTNSSEFAIYPNNANAVYYWDGGSWNYSSPYDPNPSLPNGESGIHALPTTLADTNNGVGGGGNQSNTSMIIEVGGYEGGTTCVQPIIQFRPKCGGVRTAQIHVSAIDYPGANPSGCYDRYYNLAPEAVALLNIPSNILPTPNPPMPAVLVGTNVLIPNMVFSNQGGAPLKLYSISWFNFATNTWELGGSCPTATSITGIDPTNQFSISNTSLLNGLPTVPTGGSNINAYSNLTLKFLFTPIYDGLQRALFRIRIGCECYEYVLEMKGSAPGGTFIAKINGIDYDLDKKTIELFKSNILCGDALNVIPIKVTNTSSIPFQINGINLFENDTSINQGSPSFLTKIDPSTGGLMVSKDYMITRTYPKLPFNSNIPANPFSMPKLGDTTTLYLSFNPQGYGKRYGKLIFCTNGYFNPSSVAPYIATKNGSSGTSPCGTTRGVLSIDLFGSGTGAILSKNLKGDKFDKILFDDTRLNENTDQWVYIYNTGSTVCDLNISKIELNNGDVDDVKEFVILKMPSTNSIKYGKKDSLLIRFTPKQVGTRSAIMFIRSNDVRPFNPGYDEKGVTRVQISGKGLPGIYNQKEYDFGIAIINDIESVVVQQNIEFINNSLNKISIASMKLTGVNSNEFYLISKPKYPVNLLPSDKIGILIGFVPEKNSLPGFRSAILEITTIDGSIINYPLKGEAATRTLKIVSVSDPLVFGSPSVNTVKRITILVSNTGTTLLNISGISVSGIDASSFTLGKVARLILDPGMSIPLEISFLPTSSGAKSAQLSVLSNSTNGKQQLMLQGIGVIVKKASHPKID